MVKFSAAFEWAGAVVTGPPACSVVSSRSADMFLFLFSPVRRDISFYVLNVCSYLPAAAMLSRDVVVRGLSCSLLATRSFAFGCGCWFLSIPFHPRMV